MDEARHRLSVSVDKATASAKKVRQHTEAANVSAGKVATLSGTVEVKLGQLHGRVTAELRPAVEDIQKDLAAEKQEEVVLTNTLLSAITEEKALDTTLAQAQDDKAKLTAESQKYAEEAQLLADNATKERDARIKAEKSLSWYRWHSFFLKLVTGVVILIVIGVAILWFTGGLAKIAAKFVA